MNMKLTMKWACVVLLLCACVDVEAQMPQTPQDIINMAVGSMQFDFSNYVNSTPQQQQQMYQQQQQQYQQQQQQQSQQQNSTSSSSSAGQHICKLCNGTGLMIKNDATDFGEKWCETCRTRVPGSHYHNTCVSCGGKGRW